jgi:hypothetical protein
MLHSTTRRRPLGLENLENRNLLAGNVLVSVTAGDLLITGDASSNGVEILPTANAGEYTIKGLFLNSATKINGGTAAVTVSGVTDDVNITMKGGHDKLKIGSFARTCLFPDDVTIRSDVGNDSVTMQQVTADVLALYQGVDTDPLNNNDSLVMNTVNLRWADLKLGAGDDYTKIVASKVRQSLLVNAGPGADTMESTNLRAGTVDMVLGLETENDKDTLISTDTTITNAATIKLGGGDDTITFSKATVTNRVTLDLGAGNDTGTISSSSAGEVYLYCGLGNDTGTFTGPLTVGNVFARGGAGTDTGNAFNILEISVTGDYDVDEFESGDL